LRFFYLKAYSFYRGEIFTRQVYDEPDAKVVQPWRDVSFSLRKAI